MKYYDKNYINKLRMIKSYLDEKLLYLEVTKGKKLTKADKAKQDAIITLNDLVDKKLKELEQQ